MKITGRNLPAIHQEPVEPGNESPPQPAGRGSKPPGAGAFLKDGLGPPLRGGAPGTPGTLPTAGDARQRPRTELAKLGARFSAAAGPRAPLIASGAAMHAASAQPSLAARLPAAHPPPPTDWQRVWNAGTISKTRRDAVAELHAFGLTPAPDHPAFDDKDIARYRAALHELAGDDGKDFDDLWAGIHTACVVGGRKKMMAVSTLLDMKLLDPDQIGSDGRTMIHTVASFANRMPFMEDQPRFAPFLPGRPGFKKMDEGYMSVDERVALLASAGADLNASMHDLRNRFEKKLREAGHSVEEIDDALDRHGLSTDPRWQALRDGGAHRWGSNTPAQRQELIDRTVRLYGSPLLNTLLIRETLPRGRDADYSRTTAALALIRNGADLQRPIVSEELRETELPVYPLHAAAYMHDREVVQAFADNGADLHVADENGDTALHWALLAKHGTANVDAVVGALLDATDNALLGTANREKALPLHYALSRPGNLATVTALLDRSDPAAVTARTDSGETPLHVAARQPGNVPVLRALLARGADAGITFTTHGTTLVREEASPVSQNELMSCTALHYAALFAKDSDMAGELIHAFRDFALRTFTNQGHPAEVAAPAADRDTLLWVDARNYRDEHTALHFAASSDNPALVDQLIAAGADVNAAEHAGMTPLVLAAQAGNHRMVQSLLDAGATVERHPLAVFFAAQSTNPRVIRTLLENNGSNFLHRVTNTGETLLHAAAKTPGNAATLKVLLDAGAIDDIHAKTHVLSNGSGAETPLQLAAKVPGNHEVVKLLLEAGANSDLEVRNHQGDTALQLAVQHPDTLETVRLLLNAGAQPRPETAGQMPLLHDVAAFASEPALVDLLLGARAVLHSTNADGGTVMHAAARSNHPEVVQKLLDAGARAFINTRTTNDVSPLHVAALESNHPQVVALLLKAGADPHASLAGVNVLHMVAKRFSEEPGMIELLVNAGVDIDRKADPGDLEFDEDDDAAGYYGLNPLQLAVREGSHSTAGKLLQLGANPNVRDADNATLLHTHLESHTRGPYFTEQLLRAGIDPNARDSKGNTALHVYLASHWHNADVVDALLDHGADMHARNDENDTVLAIATRSHSPEIDVRLVDSLLAKGADIHQRSGKDRNLLMEALGAIASADFSDWPEAVMRQKIPMMQRFLDAGVAVDETDGQGSTALHLALEHNVKELVPALLGRNANALLADRHGVTAADMAARHRHATLNSPWRDIEGVHMDTDVTMEDSVIAAGAAQLDRLKSRATPDSVKSAALEQIVSSLEQADPQYGPLEPPASVTLSPAASDNGDPWDDARVERARARAVDETRVANWNAFGRHVLAARDVHRSMSVGASAGPAMQARLRTLLDRIPPEMQPA